MKLSKKILTALLLVLSTNSVLAAATTTVNRDTLSMDETLTLIITSDDPKGVDELNLQPIEVDFEVLGNSQSSQYSIANGKTTSSKTWQITLAPKRPGKLRIPALEIGKDRSRSIGVTVSKSVPMQQRAGVDNIFMEAEISLEKAWVQQEIVYTTRIFYYPGLNRGADLEALQVPNAIITQLSEANFTRTIRGKNYNVYEVKYALFPQSSGLLKIPGQIFVGALAEPKQSNSFFGYGSRGKTVRLRNTNKEILIEPRPTNFKGKHWLPARNITLREKWSENPNGMQVGAPLTRSVIVEADGLQASQLPPLELLQPVGAQMYPDEPTDHEVADAKGVRSIRTEQMAIIPSAQGNLTLPEIRFNWWNTNTQRMETASIAERTFSVLPGTSAVAQNPVAGGLDLANPEAPISATASAVNAASDKPSAINWKYFFFAAIALWLATLAAYFRKSSPIASREVSRANTVKTLDESSAFQRCQTSLKQPQQLRRNLIKWAKLQWPGVKVNSVIDIANLCENKTATEQLKALDASLFQDQSGRSDHFDAERLLQELTKVRSARQGPSGQHAEKLAPLYQSD